MQRKEIEKIPYLTAQVVQNNDIKYVTEAAVKTIKNTKILMLEIYENHPSKINTPVVRICLSKDDYENYYPKDKKWSTKKITTDYYSTEILGKYMTNRDLREKVYFSKHTRNAIYGFIQNSGNDDPVSVISKAEDEIISKKEDRKYDNAKKKTKELIANAPEHTQTFYDWAKTLIPANYMYYLRKGNTAFLTCTHCGNREKYYTGQPVALEDYARTYIDVPKAGNKCVCRFCNAQAEYKQEGHYKGAWNKYAYAYDIQNNDGKAVITLVNVKKIYTNGEPEQYEFKDLIKAVYSPGRKTADKAYKPHNTWTNTNGKFGWGGWDNDHVEATEVKGIQVYGMSNLKGTPLQYSGLKEFYNSRMETSPIKYADAYLKHKELEMLSKMGLAYIAKETISHGKQIMEGKKPYQMLRIFPERLPALIKSKGTSDLWKIYKLEKSCNIHLSEEAVKQLKKYGTYQFENIKQCLKYVSYTKFENYMQKNRWNIVEYSDYLRLKNDAGYNMQDSIILFPANLHEAHQRIVDETNMAAAEKRMAEKNNTYPNIAKNYKKLKAKFGYETEEFVIRPAKDAAEIILEGQRMHHCVGSSDTYMSKHNNDKSYILLLRKASEPDIAYCTIEISPDFHIIQWQQAYDQKPDEKIIKPVLDEYLKTKTLRVKAM